MNPEQVLSSSHKAECKSKSQSEGPDRGSIQPAQVTVLIQLAVGYCKKRIGITGRQIWRSDTNCRRSSPTWTGGRNQREGGQHNLVAGTDLAGDFLQARLARDDFPMRRISAPWRNQDPIMHSLRLAHTINAGWCFFAIRAQPCSQCKVQLIFARTAWPQQGVETCLSSEVPDSTYLHCKQVCSCHTWHREAVDMLMLIFAGASLCACALDESMLFRTLAGSCCVCASVPGQR